MVVDVEDKGPHGHTWQKTGDAVRLLIGDGDLIDRLKLATTPLVQVVSGAYLGELVQIIRSINSVWHVHSNLFT